VLSKPSFQLEIPGQSEPHERDSPGTTSRSKLVAGCIFDFERSVRNSASLICRRYRDFDIDSRAEEGCILSCSHLTSFRAFRHGNIFSFDPVVGNYVLLDFLPTKENRPSRLVERYYATLHPRIHSPSRSAEAMRNFSFRDKALNWLGRFNVIFFNAFHVSNVVRCCNYTWKNNISQKMPS